MSLDQWETLPSDLPDLFDRLRARGSVEAVLRFRIGTEGGYRVEIPAVSMRLQGTLTVQGPADRLELALPGWGPEDFAYFARRRGRGGPDYWQGAVEYRPQGSPAVVVYFTAPVDGLEISVRR